MNAWRMSMRNPQPLGRGSRRKAQWLAAAGPFFVILGAGVAFLVSHWPFTQESLVKALQGNSSRPVAIRTFHKTYLPHPGCVAEGVSVHWNDEGRPALIKIEKLTIQGAYHDVITARKRIDQIRVERLHIRVLARREPSRPSGGSKKSELVIGALLANGAIVEIDRDQPGQDALKFIAKKLKLESVGVDRTVSFDATLLNPEPPGELRVIGHVGPWKSGDRGKTPVSGSYRFEHANLGVFRAIAGTLSSKGNFDGVLDHVEVRGTTDTPDFEVTRSGHAVHLASQFHAIVNGANGDTLLQRVDAHFGRTTVVSEGDVTGKPGQKGKTVSQVMRVTDGRIQDLLRLFLKSERPPLTGVISLSARALVPPEQRKFLEKLVLQGDFGIGGGHFTSPETQGNIEKLSERARGDKDHDDNPESVISNLKGHVVLRNGIANLSNISFSVPGAFAELAGTYNLLTEEVDLAGTLHMDAKLSQATKGFKSFLLKAVDPFFKDRKTNANAAIPVKITGTYSHPSYGLALGGRKSKTD